MKLQSSRCKEKAGKGPSAHYIDTCSNKTQAFNFILPEDTEQSENRSGSREEKSYKETLQNNPDIIESESEIESDTSDTEVIVERYVIPQRRNDRHQR